MPRSANTPSVSITHTPSLTQKERERERERGRERERERESVCVCVRVCESKHHTLLPYINLHLGTLLFQLNAKEYPMSSGFITKGKQEIRPEEKWRISEKETKEEEKEEEEEEEEEDV